MTRTHPPTTAQTELSNRQLNRALLERQLLLERASMPTLQAVEHLVGLQAQEPGDPYVALWSRLAAFKAEELSDLIADRAAVRAWLMRATIHLASAADALVLCPLHHPVRVRGFNGAFGRQLGEIDREAVAAFTKASLEEQPQTTAQIRRRLVEQWPDADAEAIGHLVRTLVPVVQMPPRGLWGGRGQVVLASMEDWLGRPVQPDPSPDEVVMRYLAAFGPASNADIRTWCGLPALKEVTERLRPRLRTYRDERGRELFDVPDAPLPHPDTPAPPRFLPEFDNVWLSHDDRSRIVSGEVRTRFNDISLSRGSLKLLVDGFIRGEWRLLRDQGTATLTVTLFDQLTKAERAAIEDEASHLVTFMAPDDSADIRIQ